jgi:hypothetical protein
MTNRSTMTVLRRIDEGRVVCASFKFPMKNARGRVMYIAELKSIFDPVGQTDHYYFSREEGQYLEITKPEFEAVMRNPNLYYFSTAFWVHHRLNEGKVDKW